ncbi:MAG: bifunctional folylpolyglutamate synthase/dihydrofolate synthase [Campylobacterales bacterium]|nr:bifunctional folylpolyglutamate synthase/dihydrofolate synthase [Campylobacterales bacterium]
MSEFETFLNQKPIYYDKFDLARIKKAYELLKPLINLKYVIHLIGTNGKGSTGRFLATYLHNLGFKVGHYTSPHVLKFNERIWIHGADIDDNHLNTLFEKLNSLLPKDIIEALSYFEYTTLLSFLAFDNFDFCIIEAGLGGEFDATNVLTKDISILTNIGYDHQAFLGDTLKSITTTKLKSVNKKLIVSNQTYSEVLDIVDDFCKTDNIEKIEIDFSREFKEKILNFCKQNLLSSYLALNLETALKVVKCLNLEIDLKYVNGFKIRGRFEKIAKNIIVDVGHNELSAIMIKQELNDKKINLIYNSLDDKDYKKIISILKDNIKELLIIPIDSARAVKLDKLFEELHEYNPKLFIDIKDDEEYLVFGSFVVVETFLRWFEKE